MQAPLALLNAGVNAEEVPVWWMGCWLATSKCQLKPE